MTEKAPPRPAQVTMACALVVIGSVFLVLTVFTTMSDLNTVDMRQRLSDALSTPSTRGLGVSVAEAIRIMRVGLFVAGAAAAAAAVLGVYALQRNRGARVALTVAAVPIVLSAPFSGGLLAALIGVSIGMLWAPQARDWFAGRMPPERPAQRPIERPAERGAPDAPAGPGRADPAPPAPPTSASPWEPSPPTSGPALGPSAAAPPPPHSPSYGVSAAYSPRPYLAPVDPDEVPTSVRIATLLTWLFSASTALIYLVLVVVLAVDSDQIVRRVLATQAWQDAHQNPNLLRPALWVGAIGLLTWSLAACVLAWFVRRRHKWAWLLLIVSTVVAALVSVFAFPVTVAHLIGMAATVSLLLGAPARDWMRAPSTPSGPPPGPHAGAPPDQGASSGRPHVW